MRKLLGKAVIFSIIASASFAEVSFADVTANTLPSFNSGTNVNVTAVNNNMNIKVTGGSNSVGTANWNSFNIGKNASVNVEFSAHNQTSLNKVNAAGGMSQIYGNFTNSSSCPACGYDSTGKVILLNPNGVLFGNGANVNLNSFTASTMDGSYNKSTNQLSLSNKSNSNNGIIVENGANIYGDKGVNFASSNVTTYDGSKISTNINNNVGDTGVGKVKIVTADGVNFKYYNNGGVNSLSNITNSSNAMKINLNGVITSGNIDVRNMSTNTNSSISAAGATLKAVKAEKGNDGNIWLISNNNINMNNSSNLADGNIVVKAKNTLNANNTKLAANGDINLNSSKKSVKLNGNEIKSDNNVVINSKKSLYMNSNKITTGEDLQLNVKNNLIYDNNNDINTYTNGVTLSGMMVEPPITPDEPIEPEPISSGQMPINTQPPVEPEPISSSGMILPETEATVTPVQPTKIEVNTTNNQNAGTSYWNSFNIDEKENVKVEFTSNKSSLNATNLASDIKASVEALKNEIKASANQSCASASNCSSTTGSQVTTGIYQGIGQNPTLVQGIQQSPTVVQKISQSPTVVQQISQSPTLVQTITQSPTVVQVINQGTPTPTPTPTPTCGAGEVDILTPEII